MALTLLATVVVLGVLIFVHELGHFVAAKAVDIEVSRFSIGIGPVMTGIRRGETEYVISWLPLGGYVKMEGMADEAATAKLEGGAAEERREPSPRDFDAKPLWARTLVILAGVAMNWLFAIVAFGVLAFERGVQEPLIGEVLPGSPAAEVGLQPGDKFLSLDGIAVRNFQQVAMVTEERAGKEIPLAVERDGETIYLRATPEPIKRFSELQRDTVTVGRLGVSLSQDAYRPLSAGGAIVQGWDDTVYWTVTVLRFLKRLVAGQTSVRELGGPIMIGQISGEAARSGIWALLSFMAVISINLAVLNLLPIPVLDGGHLVFLAVEAVRGRAVSVEQRIKWTTAGMLVVMGLMVWAIGNDLLRIVGI